MLDIPTDIGLLNLTKKVLGQCEQDLRNSAPRRSDQSEGGNDGRAGVPDSGEQADDWVEPEPESGPGDAEEIIHDESNPLEERIQ